MLPCKDGFTYFRVKDMKIKEQEMNAIYSVRIMIINLGS